VLITDATAVPVKEVANVHSIVKVKVVVVEYNPIFGSDFAVSVPQDDNFDRFVKHSSGLYFGASLMAFISTLSKKDFVFIGSNRVGNNAFFIAKNSIKKIGLLPI